MKLPQPEIITPSIAKEMLKGNTGNRTVRKQAVEQLARLMRDGKWRMTHQGIAIASDGRVLDGQHRLLAVVLANIPVHMLVTRDCDPEDFQWMDGGIIRKPADRLKLLNDDHDNARCVAIVTSYLRYAVLKTGVGMSVDVIEDTFLQMSTSFEWASLRFRSIRKGITRSTIGAAIAIYHHVDREKATDFTDGLLEGVNLVESDPALVLREVIRSGRLPQASPLGYWKTMAAAIAHRADKRITKLVTPSVDLVGNRLERLYSRRRQSAQKGVKNRRENEQEEITP